MAEEITGQIYKAVSGFYYVRVEEKTVECRARGRFRADGISPLVGDFVEIKANGEERGTIVTVLPRKSSFVRPQVANIDIMVMVASAAIPETDPFLIDRVTAISAAAGCRNIVCINKSDLNHGDKLYEIYQNAGIDVVRTSAVTGEGLERLNEMLSGSLCAFTGNSGVGKTSLLNRLKPGLLLQTGEISEKLGRGRHTTRHVELFDLDNGIRVVDTPGFSSFDVEEMEPVPKELLQDVFTDFSPYVSQCYFTGCSHIKEKGCAVLNALSEGKIEKTRHESYVRLYEQAKEIREWQKKDYIKYSDRKTK